MDVDAHSAYFSVTFSPRRPHGRANCREASLRCFSWVEGAFPSRIPCHLPGPFCLTSQNLITPIKSIVLSLFTFLFMYISKRGTVTVIVLPLERGVAPPLTERFIFSRDCMHTYIYI